MDPRKHDLPVAAVDQTPEAAEDIGRGRAPALPPHARDDAKGAGLVAAVLDLKQAAGPIRKCFFVGSWRSGREYRRKGSGGDLRLNLISFSNRGWS